MANGVISPHFAVADRYVGQMKPILKASGLTDEHSTTPVLSNVLLRSSLRNATEEGLILLQGDSSGAKGYTRLLVILAGGDCIVRSHQLSPWKQMQDGPNLEHAFAEARFLSMPRQSSERSCCHS